MARVRRELARTEKNLHLTQVRSVPLEVRLQAPKLSRLLPVPSLAGKVWHNEQ